MAMGIKAYNQECRSIVMRYAQEWRTTIDRLGRWIDFDNDYKVRFLFSQFSASCTNISLPEHVPNIYGECVVGL